MDRTARQITAGPSKALLESFDLGIRQGQVQAVDVINQKVDITLGGGDVTIPAVSHASNYRPHVNDVVWVLTIGNDLLVYDRVGAFGPSIFSTASASFVLTEQARTSSSYGDLATVGPTATVDVSPSGVLLVQVSCWMIMDTNTNGGAMGLELSGANSLSPSDLEAEVFVFGLTNAVGASSKVTLIYGLSPGATTITTKYRSTTGGSSCSFSLRHLWALPL